MFESEIEPISPEKPTDISDTVTLTFQEMTQPTTKQIANYLNSGEKIRLSTYFMP